MAMGFLRELFFSRTFEVDKRGPKLFKNIRYSILNAKAMARLLQEVGEKKGEDYLYDLGWEAGYDAGKEMIQYMKIRIYIPFLSLKAIQFLLDIIGFGRFKTLIFLPGKGKALIHVTDHPVIEAAKELFGEKSKVCAFYRGVYSAHAEQEVSVKNARFIETQCICKGSKYCEWSTGGVV